VARPFRTVTATLALAGVAVTAVIGWVPAARFAYHAPSLHVALETAAALVAVLAAYLIFGRFRDTRMASDLVLVCALALLALTNSVFSALPASIGGRSSSLETWAPLTGRFIAAALLPVAAFLPVRKLRRPRRATVLALAGVGLVLVGIGTAFGFGPALPHGIDPTLSPSAGSRPELSGFTLVVAAQMSALVLYAVAAIGFTRRAEQSGDHLTRWLAVALVFAAMSALNYFLYPSLYSDWVYTGDGFRLLFYLALLGGAAREIDSYWRGLAQAAVLEERRRLARDLHDGLAQELAFVHRQAARIARTGDPRAVAQLTAASERALDESRRAIAALTRPLDEPLDVVLRRAVEVVAERNGASVSLDLVAGRELSAAHREAIVRIACEAVENAARHGRARTIGVELRAGDPLRLLVTDDGVGFDATAADGRDLALGLTSMRERAQALGAELRIASRPGDGTTVELVLP
jgi:signal transduction histidine kinase